MAVDDGGKHPAVEAHSLGVMEAARSRGAAPGSRMAVVAHSQGVAVAHSHAVAAAQQAEVHSHEEQVVAARQAAHRSRAGPPLVVAPHSHVEQAAAPHSLKLEAAHSLVCQCSVVAHTQGAVAHQVAGSGCWGELAAAVAAVRRRGRQAAAGVSHHVAVHAAAGGLAL
mmetsp:Transcript_49002/g.138954  ORF Transcript_49002/g.138954 Transcript_49002/m.138954 type:complete len:168 (-) Transcript_49002:90-593(-)